eukprot:CAMPEP_0197718850 /NCGR_PEP_ID=MMETSP1434-20131217/2838_1 /TAXON_ID=265543 /ORGANISM="Minutocellus polymorphus, Strain CCMP3303" /LENGTH=391 /DNA_ID=CAMNT_0043303541 /DNA_START=193 /DNA_END=1368 /DNA_ORIENTATION=+
MSSSISTANDGEPTGSDAAQSLMELASRHFASQALNAFVKMGVPDILGADFMSIEQISGLLDEGISSNSQRRNVNRDGLLRIMRLMAAEGILEQSSAPINGSSSTEEQKVTFGLTAKGNLLKSGGQQALASVVLHWMEKPLWNAWAELPDYVAGDCVVEQGNEEAGKEAKNALPFEKANGMSSDDYYCQENAESLKNANEFVRYISAEEERAVLSGFNWSQLSGKTLLDVGGHQGKIMSLIASKYPGIKCKCFDLPEVVSSVTALEGVELLGGDIFDGDLPSCDVIFMKHFLDKTMWNEEQTIQILSSCRDTLPDDGQIIIAEAVLPDDCVNASGANRLHLYVDVLFLLVGREAARTETEWTSLVEKAGLRVDWITATSAPSCYMIVLSKA